MKTNFNKPDVLDIIPQDFKPNTNVEVNYRGPLAKEGSNEIFVHFGSSKWNKWDNVSEVKMSKNPNGTFSANIHVPKGDNLSLTFRDASGRWDNNESSNYVFKLK